MIDPNDAAKEIAELERWLTLPKDYILSILNNDDDWALTIKLHSLIETVLGQFIVTTVGKTELEEDLSKLNFWTKLSMTKRLGILDKGPYQFLSRLSQLRNRYIHNIKNVGRALVDISKEAEIELFRKYSDNDKLRLFIWSMSIIILVIVKKHFTVEKAHKEMKDIESFLGKLKINELKVATKI